MLKTTLFGVGIALLSGCASNTQPVRDTKIGSSTLVVKFEKAANKQEFTQITNKNVQGFSLNTLEPLYFNKQYIDLGSDLVLSTKFKEPEDKYTKIGCKQLNTVDVAKNVILFPALLSGGFCRKAQYFDYKEFDEDAKEWVENNKINRKEILSKYDTLENTQYFSQVEINELANAKYTPIVEKYYQDGEKLKSSIFPNSNIKPQHIKAKRDPISYQSIVDNIFPCKIDCIDKINLATKEIQDRYDSDKNRLETSDSELAQLENRVNHYLAEYKADLEKAKKIEDARVAQIAQEKLKQQKIQEEEEKQQRIKDAAKKKAFEEQMKKIGE